MSVADLITLVSLPLTAFFVLFAFRQVREIKKLRKRDSDSR